jgi:hypothetical protein
MHPRSRDGSSASSAFSATLPSVVQRQISLAGSELMHMLKHGQLVGAAWAEGLTSAVPFYTLDAAS